jgi:hypothetical protein
MRDLGAVRSPHMRAKKPGNQAVLKMRGFLRPSRVSGSRVIFFHRANISFVDLQKSVANVTGDLSSATRSNSEGRRCMKCPLWRIGATSLYGKTGRVPAAPAEWLALATPNNYRIDWTEMPLPSLRGALATKQSRGRVIPPLDCFAALAMTGGELARLFLGVAFQPRGARRVPRVARPRRGSEPGYPLSRSGYESCWRSRSCSPARRPLLCDDRLPQRPGSAEGRCVTSNGGTDFSLHKTEFVLG